MGCLSQANKNSIFTVGEYLPVIRETGDIQGEVGKLEDSVKLIETQLMMARNPKDIQYLRELLVHTNYAICVLKQQEV